MEKKNDDDDEGNDTEKEDSFQEMTMSGLSIESRVFKVLYYLMNKNAIIHILEKMTKKY
jgi:hypothetical protein